MNTIVTFLPGTVSGFIKMPAVTSVLHKVEILGNTANNHNEGVKTSRGPKLF